MTPLTAGRVARRLLAFFKKDGSNWARGYFAYNATGLYRGGEAPDAVRFCAVGALRCILQPRKSTKRSVRYSEARNILDEASGWNRTLEGVNDGCKNFQQFKKRLHEIARTP